jgi:hypothetical protein
LGALFPLGTFISDIPDKLNLYTTCRYERATIIQDYSRQSGQKVKGSKYGKKGQMEPMQFTSYNFDHDAHDFASGALKRYLVEKAGYKRMPLSFGPSPGPRQDLQGQKRITNAPARYRTAYMTFKTKKSYLQTLMPTKEFNIKSQGGWTTATFSITRLENLQWLGGRGYGHFGLYIDNVAYNGELDPRSTALEAKEKLGSLLPVLFENMADPIITGREELGFSKVFATLQETQTQGSYTLNAGWEGTNFCQMKLTDLVAEEATVPIDEAPLYHYKVIPSSRREGELDTEYTTVSQLKLGKDGKEKRWKAGKAEISFCDLQNEELERAFPTLANIIEGLREIEVCEVIASGIRESQ